MDYSGIAGELASRGRYGDSMLMHVNPMEVEGLASIVPITRNPDTGLPEAFWPLLIGAALGGLAGGLNAKSNDTPLLQGILGGAVLGGLGGSGIGAMAGAGGAGIAGAAAPVVESAAAGGAGTAAAGGAGTAAAGGAGAGGAALSSPLLPSAAEGLMSSLPPSVQSLPGLSGSAGTLGSAASSSLGSGASSSLLPSAAEGFTSSLPLNVQSLPGLSGSAGTSMASLGSGGSLLPAGVSPEFALPSLSEGFAVNPGAVEAPGGIMSNVTGAQNKIGNFVVDNPGTTLMGLAALDAVMPKQELEEDFGGSAFEGDPTWADMEQQPRSYAGTSPGGRQRSYFGRV